MNCKEREGRVRFYITRNRKRKREGWEKERRRRCGENKYLGRVPAEVSLR